MPFSKRICEPLLLSRYGSAERGRVFEDLPAVSNYTLGRTLRQLAHLAKHACGLFQEIEDEVLAVHRRLYGIQRKISDIGAAVNALQPRQETVPVSNLDRESKLTVYYRAPWYQQEDLFHPSTRPPCVEELHHCAKQKLQFLHKEHQRQFGERRLMKPPSMLPPPLSLIQHRNRLRAQKKQHILTFHSIRSSSPTECCQMTPWSRKSIPPTDGDSDTIALGQRPKNPIPNIPTTLDRQTNWSKDLPLPTPEQKMRQQAQAIASCVIPINVTGVGFERQVIGRYSFVHPQSVLQRRRKLKRRKTISGIPRRVQQEIDSDVSPMARERNVIVHVNPELDFHGVEANSTSGRSGTKDSECQTEDILIAAPSVRRIRAQRGNNIVSSLSHSAGNITTLADDSSSMFLTPIDSHVRSRSLSREGIRDSLFSRELSQDDSVESITGTREKYLPNPGMAEEEDEERLFIQSPQKHHSKGVTVQPQQKPEHKGSVTKISNFMPEGDTGNSEISSNSDTFGSPVNSISSAGALLSSQIDQKEDHQSSSGNWSGSNSTCPSQTSETIHTASSPPLTGSSHCDSELSLNTPAHTNYDSSGFLLEQYTYPGDKVRGHRTNSFTSTGTDVVEDLNTSNTSDAEWNYLHHCHDASCHRDFSPRHSRTNSLGCPSFASMGTCDSFVERPSSSRTDSGSYFSVDTEGYYTSMHFDCGLKTNRNYIFNYASTSSDGIQSTENTSELGEFPQPDHSELRKQKCRGQSIALKKPKAKPAPPKRSSSLRKNESCANENDQTEPKTNNGQNRTVPSRDTQKALQLDLSIASDRFKGCIPPGKKNNPWDSHSGYTNDNELSDPQLTPSDMPSFKDEGAVQSDYAGLWLLNDLKSNDPYRSLSNSSTATGTTVIECTKSPEGSESQTSQSESRATTPSLPSVENEFKLSSPDKLASLASPSSGYSSQSGTPTSTLPTPLFPGPLSPNSGKRKPKVPERRSSLQQSSTRDVNVTKKDLELPTIPPTHLDLSALQNLFKSKPFSHRNQLHISNQSKPREAAEKTNNSATVSLGITPSVLQSVQLRSINKGRKSKQECQEEPDLIEEPNYAESITPPDRTEPNRSLTHKCSEISNSPQLLRKLSSTNTNPSILHLESNFALCLEKKLSKESMPPFPLVSTAAQSLTQLTVSGECPRNTELEDNQVVTTDGCHTVCKYSNKNNSVKESAPQEIEQDFRYSNKDLQNEVFSQEIGVEEKPESVHSPCNRVTEILPATILGPATAEKLERKLDFDSVKDDETVPHDVIQPIGAPRLNKSSADEKSERVQDGCPESATDPSRIADALCQSSSNGQYKDHLDVGQGENYLISPVDLETNEDNVFISPNRLRTTEDLFAVIHRSKRKLLGRKDSDEGPNVNKPKPSPGSSPGTPPATQKQSSPIYRSVRKSNTSHEEFKLLLLKKGSRSDSNYRLSAAEILKSASPVSPKSPGDSSSEQAKDCEDNPPFPSGCEMQSPVAPCSPRFSTEGISSRSFSASLSSRPSRSRAPPAAGSSRYSVRSRLHSAPMQVISEGEAENSDGSPHDDRNSQDTY
ncbi:Nance-Horan syndrome protein isoform X2 [Scyliorhinus canicula]|uniref:Nance-Horan syndrome protein isoform X2 n=1 Tax=Scyliorhinus canicula TaxID=7830 RepID=UPI0018F69870|nr:Nance-Horan syndrome protein isoform X2 [Scyliorhinus canicula]